MRCKFILIALVLTGCATKTTCPETREHPVYENPKTCEVRIRRVVTVSGDLPKSRKDDDLSDYDVRWIDIESSLNEIVPGHFALKKRKSLP